MTKTIEFNINFENIDCKKLMRGQNFVSLQNIINMYSKIRGDFLVGYPIPRKKIPSLKNPGIKIVKEILKSGIKSPDFRKSSIAGDKDPYILTCLVSNLFFEINRSKLSH